MAGLADDFRAQAKEQAAGSMALIEGKDFGKDPTKLVAAIVGQVHSATLTALADMMDYQSRVGGLEASQSRMAQLLKKNAAIRKAAATEDWTEYDRLTSGGDIDPGGNGTPIPSGSTGGNPG